MSMNQRITAINLFIEIDGKQCIAPIDPAKCELLIGMLPAFQSGDSKDATLYPLPLAATEKLIETRRAILDHFNKSKS